MSLHDKAVLQEIRAKLQKAVKSKKFTVVEMNAIIEELTELINK